MKIFFLSAFSCHSGHDTQRVKRTSLARLPSPFRNFDDALHVFKAAAALTKHHSHLLYVKLCSLNGFTIASWPAKSAQFSTTGQHVISSTIHIHRNHNARASISGNLCRAAARVSTLSSRARTWPAVCNHHNRTVFEALSLSVPVRLWRDSRRKK